VNFFAFQWAKSQENPFEEILGQGVPENGCRDAHILLSKQYFFILKGKYKNETETKQGAPKQWGQQ
jgi:hypothetical protein